MTTPPSKVRSSPSIRLSSDVTASWVQAFGSIAAIVVVTLPVLLQQSLARSEARMATLSTVQLGHELDGLFDADDFPRTSDQSSIG